MSKKYYYIDENGIKKYYAGKVIKDYVTNETYGLLTQQENIQEKKELEYHEGIEAQEGWSSYFSYIDENGKSKIYDGPINSIRKNLDNTYYITKINKQEINLIYHPEIPSKPAYFTYLDNEKKVIYEDEPFYDKFTNSYYFYK